MDPELKDLDFYKILEIQQSATDKEIKTAYRKKALKCHPDKNPNDPEAAQTFMRLSKILSVLTDTEARCKYDKSLNARTAKKCDYYMNILNLEKELESLKRDFELLEQETEKERIGSYILRLKWKKKGVYDKAKLTSLFSKYGDILSVVVLQNNKPMGFVQYKSKTSAINAKNEEVGLKSCPLIVSFLGEYGPDTK
ncbi:unnamed protein product [Macrosiphum euphorbiae]|uniref:Uncharacterized protein n=1 Tax=Macrosiphum euphorbiae TaxID=13131 RepID=A0AAV0Y1J8_9HEMI|nr:unnamed protein product [Macrosiphum euphorbiae]